MTAPITLVLGGQRSGKSAHAEALALRPTGQATYLATAEAFDGAMRARIEAHIARRGAAWQTHEEPLAIAPLIPALSAPDRPLLVECLTTWVGSLMHQGLDVQGETDAVLDALNQAEGPVIFVSGEVGLGIIPDNAMARTYADHLGRLNQQVAAKASNVVLVAAGLPLVLKE